ncbi:hypothetical protein QTG54_010099 [Skeletonema marinoi]|uniref:Transmembrane protein n=1 Tax=Skeletonema marinoi TaxID=267567 RepID=A0AAD9D9V4_9STRA|nr:hypothetical protein QTG54_010099 [Skeletonema marinoi]
MTITKDSSISIRGPQLLLFSLAGAGTAAGITLTRWLLTETGEVMLLFSDNNNGGEDEYCDATTGLNEDNIIYPHQEASFDEIPEIIASSCIVPSSSSPTTIKAIGQSLLIISSSPHLRSIPIFLILLSSTTFLIGIILTHKQLSRLSQSISNYQERVNKHVISMIKMVFGEEIGDEMEVQQPTMSISSISEVLSGVIQLQKQQMSNSILMKMDNMVMDEYVQWFIQNGVELAFGLGGGIALYSLPETVFSSSSDNDEGNKGTIVRQRLIHAADPWLERVLFHPGGMWDALPSGCRGLLMNDQERKQEVVAMVGQRQEEGVKIKMIDDSLDTTQETLVGTEISAASIGSTDNETDDDEFASTPIRHAHSPPMSSVEMKTTTGDISSKESVGEALYATICDVVASNVANAFQSRESTSRTPRHEREENDGNRQQPPSPQEQIEKILHRTTIAATTIFLCQFLSSPTTRRSWVSAMKFLTSAGLFSTAISAGVASQLLRSSDTTAAASTLLFGDNATMTMLYSKIFDWIQVPSFPLYSSLPTSVNLEKITKKMHVMFHRLREEIKKNKRLQATFALMVLYGVKQLPGRRRNIRSGVKSRRVR